MMLQLLQLFEVPRLNKPGRLAWRLLNLMLLCLLLLLLLLPVNHLSLLLHLECQLLLLLLLLLLLRGHGPPHASKNLLLLLLLLLLSRTSSTPERVLLAKPKPGLLRGLLLLTLRRPAKAGGHLSLVGLPGRELLSLRNHALHVLQVRLLLW